MALAVPVNATRSDMANVNGWHWQESDLLEFFRKNLDDLIAKEKLYDEEGASCQLDEKITVTGEAYCNLRKGKRIVGYDVNLTAPYTAKHGETEITGKLSMPYISDENDEDETEVVVTQDDFTQPLREIKKRVRAAGIPWMRSQLKAFFARLKEQVIEGQAVQKEEIAAPPAPKPVEDGKSTSESVPKGHAPLSEGSSSTGSASKSGESKSSKTDSAAKSGVDTCTITSKSKFHCRAQDIFEVLTDPRRIMTYTRAPCEFEPKAGGQFMYLAGAITGTNVEIEGPNRIVQDWRFQTWPEGHSSRVEITISEADRGSTTVSLKQTNVPTKEKTPTQVGWQNYFWDRIHNVFGY